MRMDISPIFSICERIRSKRKSPLFEREQAVQNPIRQSGLMPGQAESTLGTTVIKARKIFTGGEMLRVSCLIRGP